jgi:N-acetylmuramoyl-L-alanine amidase
MMTLNNYPMVLMALDLWREAQNQSYAAILGVAWVVKNRIVMPHDLVYVVTKKYQFSSMTSPGDLNLVKWPETGDAAFAMCCTAAEAVFSPGAVDPTNGATFYFSPPITEPPVAEWGPVVITAKIDELTFCKAA